jgi:vacuolar-type H+-ATPase subunit B/Vma2
MPFVQPADMCAVRVPPETPGITSGTLAMQKVLMELKYAPPLISHPSYSRCHPDGHSYVPGTMICEERVET